MKRSNPDSLIVDERPDGIYINIGDFGERPVESKWKETIEKLHTLLCAHGWHRIIKQDGSQVGGEYTR